MFRNIQPDTVLVERILVRVETLEISTAGRGVVEILVHRRILLMTEDDAFAGPTLSTTFATLRTFGLLLVT